MALGRGGKTGSQVREFGVDLGSQAVHSNRGCQGNQSNQESVLDQVLTLLFLPKTFEKIFHFGFPFFYLAYLRRVLNVAAL
jgi:hypothetical protein